MLACVCNTHACLLALQRVPQVSKVKLGVRRSECALGWRGEIDTHEGIGGAVGESQPMAYSNDRSQCYHNSYVIITHYVIIIHVVITHMSL